MLAIKKLAALVAVALGSVCASSTMAATSAEKQAAIDSGLAWLAANQGVDGSWSGSGYSAADTSSALLAFIEQKYKPLGWNGSDYSAAVNNGLAYLMTQATQVNVGVRPDGFNADQAGTGHGVYWGALGETTYISGLALSTVARAVSAGYVSAGTVINSTNAAVNGKSYGTVIQESVDMYLAGQTTAASGNYRGGWHYYPSQGDADNSTTQWAAIGMLFSETAGATVPQYTKDELKYWIDYIQNANGGSGYDSPGNLVNESKTGGLLVEMAFTGYDGTAPGGGDNSDKAGALAYLNSNWQTTANSTWDGNFGHPYAMWSIYKGLESTIGLTDSTTITNLHAQGANLLDPGQTWNWWEDYSQYLVDTQNLAGNWPGYSYWPTAISTAWNVNILNATQIGPSPNPNPAPEPATLALLGLALTGVAVSRRRPLV
jgi:hypothetical protein